MIDVSTLAQEHDLSLRSDFQAYLEAFPAGARKFPLPTWSKAKAKAKPKAAKGEEHWADDVAEIYGVSALDTLYTKAKKDGDCHFWNVRFLPHAYVIARTAGGDPIVQVTRGKHAGKVLLTNHESYYGFFEHLRVMLPSADEQEFLSETGRVLKKLGVLFPKLGTDAFVDFLLHPNFDGAVVLAASFAEFYAELGAVRGFRDASEQPAPKAASAKGAGAKGDDAKGDDAKGDALPKLTVAHKPSSTTWGCDLVASGSDGKAVYFAGSILDETSFLKTTDGKKFERIACPHPDVLDLHADASELLACGGEKLLVRSTNGGRTFTEQKLDLGGDYLWGVTRDDEKRLWVVGGEGAVATSSNDGKTFETVAKGSGGVGRLTKSALGILIPSGDTLRIGRGGKVLPTKLRAKHTVNAAITTQSGTLLTVDVSGEVNRSTDGGKTWAKARIFKGAIAIDQLTCIAQSKQGWIVVAGTMWSVAVSFDDGQTFRVVDHERKILMFHSAVPHADGVLLGGSEGMVALLR